MLNSLPKDQLWLAQQDILRRVESIDDLTGDIILKLVDHIKTKVYVSDLIDAGVSARFQDLVDRTVSTRLKRDRRESTERQLWQPGHRNGLEPFWMVITGQFLC